MFYFKISLKILVIIFVIYVSDIIALPTIKNEFKEQNLTKISGIKQMRILRHLLKACENVGLKKIKFKQNINGKSFFNSLLHRMILPLLGSV